MERTDVLINKLQEQLIGKASAQQMLITTQLLQAELLNQCRSNNVKEHNKVAVIMPFNINVPIPPNFSEEKQPDINQPDTTPEPEPIHETIAEVSTPHITAHIPEPVQQDTPEPIPHFSEDKPWQRLFAEQETKNASSWPMDPMMEIPTLAHQEKTVFELNDVIHTDNGTSLNETLKQETNELANKLTGTPVKDLKKAISINDRHSFIQELFRGDEAMYERSIKTINGFHIFAEAEFWIQRELKVKLGWDNSLELVKIFDQVVSRRFS